MNVSRNTESLTPLIYLDWIQRGSTEDWKRLYALCRDPEVAQTVAHILPMRDPDLMGSALVWKYLLEDLYPDLHIELHPERLDIGV